MTVRTATYADLPRLMEIYREAREIMLGCGDVNQWKPGHPSEVLVRGDIDNGHCHVIEDSGVVVGAFALIPGEDPTYRVIEGEWLDADAPYATIHRLGSTFASKGVARTCFDWCWAQFGNLRIDTHEDNVIMRHCIESAGFKYCGTIHLLSGDPRMAFQKIAARP